MFQYKHISVFVVAFCCLYVCLFYLIHGCELKSILCTCTVCRLKLEWLDYLDAPSVKHKSGQEKLQVGNVFIEAAVVHGGDALTAILTSNEYRYEQVVRFSQWLRTSLKVHNIPKARNLTYL